MYLETPFNLVYDSDANFPRDLSQEYPSEFKEKYLVLRKAGEINKDSKLAPKWIGPYRESERWSGEEHIV